MSDLNPNVEKWSYEYFRIENLINTSDCAPYKIEGCEQFFDDFKSAYTFAILQKMEKAYIFGEDEFLFIFIKDEDKVHHKDIYEMIESSLK